MTKTEKLIRVLSDNAFYNITQTADENGAITYHFQVYTPAGEDWNIDFANADEFIELAENFDIDENVKMWLDAKQNGVAGVPGAVELVHDQEWKRDTLRKIVNAIK